jgi:hypothetical protein
MPQESPGGKIPTVKKSCRFDPNGGSLAKKEETARNSGSARTAYLSKGVTLEGALQERLLGPRDKLIKQGLVGPDDRCWFLPWLDDEEPPLIFCVFEDEDEESVDQQLRITVSKDCVTVTFAEQESVSPQPLFRVFYTRNTNGTVKIQQLQWSEELPGDKDYTNTKSFVTSDDMSSYKEAVPSDNERCGFWEVRRDSFHGIRGAKQRMLNLLKYIDLGRVKYLNDCGDEESTS